MSKLTSSVCSPDSCFLALPCIAFTAVAAADSGTLSASGFSSRTETNCPQHPPAAQCDGRLHWDGLTNRRHELGDLYGPTPCGPCFTTGHRHDRRGADLLYITPKPASSYVHLSVAWRCKERAIECLHICHCQSCNLFCNDV